MPLFYIASTPQACSATCHPQLILHARARSGRQTQPTLKFITSTHAARSPCHMSCMLLAWLQPHVHCTLKSQSFATIGIACCCLFHVRTPEAITKDPTRTFDSNNPSRQVCYNTDLTGQRVRAHAGSFRLSILTSMVSSGPPSTVSFRSGPSSHAYAPSALRSTSCVWWSKQVHGRPVV